MTCDDHEGNEPISDPSMSEDIYFKISLCCSPGGRNNKERVIGPYAEEDLNDYGEPPTEDVNTAVWEVIGDCVGMSQITKKEAREKGIL